MLAKDSIGRTALYISRRQLRPEFDYSRKVLEALEAVAQELGLLDN
jgi:hypothetical protein